ncbi:hypothetical protein AVEN_193099-1 [Araneus ventricosus]|uniref:Secreted protein n=1 Tax=Araneus ventricosus TaxID=182803 RepID=A0A4Y2AZX1_ARAVE|nr:hypothetical protein AVEN_193099-1 [Araneus ventricosus]
MSSSAAEMVALLITTCVSPSCLRVPPPNADTTGIWCTGRGNALRTPFSSCDKFVKHAPLQSEEIGYLFFVLIWRNPSCNELWEQVNYAGATGNTTTPSTG